MCGLTAKATILQLLLVVQTLLKKDGGVQVSDTTIAGKRLEAGNQDTLLLKSVHKKARRKGYCRLFLLQSYY